MFRSLSLAQTRLAFSYLGAPLHHGPRPKSWISSSSCSCHYALELPRRISSFLWTGNWMGRINWGLSHPCGTIKPSPEEPSYFCSSPFLLIRTNNGIAWRDSHPHDFEPWTKSSSIVQPLFPHSVILTTILVTHHLQLHIQRYLTLREWRHVRPQLPFQFDQNNVRAIPRTHTRRKNNAQETPWSTHRQSQPFPCRLLRRSLWMDSTQKIPMKRRLSLQPTQLMMTQ